MTAVAERFKFTVDRRTWLRGEGSAVSRLLRNDGRMCCMGSYCLARGFAPEEISDIAAINHLISGGGQLMGWEGALQSSIECNAYGINDDITMRDDVREQALARVLAPFGVDIEFTN